MAEKFTAADAVDGTWLYSGTDGVECCALGWGIRDMDRFLAKHPIPEVREMRDFLQQLYDEYASGERPCSRCAPQPKAKTNER